MKKNKILIIILIAGAIYLLLQKFNKAEETNETPEQKKTSGSGETSTEGSPKVGKKKPGSQ
jgi:hypothetical protein